MTGVRWVPVLVATTVLGCASTDGDRGATSSVDAVRSTTAPTTENPATTVASTTVATTTSTTVVPATTIATATTLPGEPVPWLPARTAAHVAGIAVGDTFDLRAAPGDEQMVAAELGPLTELTLTGQARELDAGSYPIVWVEATAGEATGWITAWSLVHLGSERDETEVAVAALGPMPSAPTMLELAAAVIEAVAPIDPSSAGAAVVRASEPAVGSPSEVVYDVFPGEEFGDDAARGGRYRIVGDQTASGFTLTLVEVRSLCTRGVDDLGVCI